MPDKTYNKCVINGTTYLDLSGDTVTADKLLQGYTAHDKNGEAITGTATSSSLVISDTTDAAGGTIRTITAQDSVYLQEKTITPTSSQQVVEPDDGYDGFSQVTVEAGGSTINNQNKSVSPSESQQTVTADTGYTGLGTVTVGAISSTYVGSGIARKSSSDLTANGATVTAPAGYYSSNATKTISSGTEGTPTASKGSVSNHAISVTPSVTNTAGYISGGTKTGTAVSVTASELVSGTLSISQNGNADVTNYASVNVSVSGGGGGSSVQVGGSVTTLSSTQGSIQFDNLLGEPSSFVVIAQDEITTGSPSRCATCVYDGTNLFGQNITNTSNAQVSYSSGSLNMSYSNGTLTIWSSGADFQAIDYTLVYTYGGGSACVNTADVQVGSGATSITFTDLDDEPLYWSCVFKSNFSTSSGYQRTIAVVYDSVDTFGLEMDSSAKYSDSHWTASYNNGSLTITSNGTNQGGYFHQPGYYQLTYAIDVNGNYQSKTVTPSSSTQIVQADEGYEALSKVTVNPIPSSYVQPTATKGATTYTPGTSNQTIASGTYLTGTQTISGDANLIAGNIKSGTTIFGVTGTYSGGGSANIGTKTTTNSSNQNTSISFSSLSGQPKAFFCRLTTQMARNSSSRYYYVENIRWDGSSTGGVEGRQFYMYNGTLTNVTSGYSYSYSNNTLTLTSTGSRSAAPGSFYNGTYELIYIY